MNAISRVLKMRSRDREIEIPIRICWPVRDEAAWSCEWEIQWPDRKRSSAARGADAIQALMNALQMVGSEIYASEAHQTGQLSWDNKWIGYGFPVPNSIRDMLVGDDKKFL
jgi:hypothetical protein